MQYESSRTFDSTSARGVRFKIARMTFGRRIELMRRVRELSGRLDFALAGSGAPDRVDAALLAAEIDDLYLRWALMSVEGLEIDGAQADTDRLIAAGPESLCREIVAAIKRECSLSEEERKN